MPQLDAAVEANPRGVRPLLARAECYYRVGRYEWVRRDLKRACSSSVAGALRQAEQEGGDDARSVVENGATLQVIMHVFDKKQGAARASYQQARGVFGDTAAMARAEIAITAGGGDTRAAWRQVDAALDRFPSDPQAKLAAAEMASRDYRNITPKANAILNAPAETVGLYNDALAAYNTRDYAGCLATTDKGIANLPEEEHTRFYALGYLCAVTGGQVSRSNTIVRDLGGISDLRPDAVIRHAELLIQRDREQAAIALLKRVRPADVNQRADAETLQVRAMTKAGDLDSAIQVALRGHARPNAIANLGMKLKNANRDAEARQVLEPACPRMQGNDATRCFDLLKRVSRD